MAGKVGDLSSKLGGVFNPAMLQPGGPPKRPQGASAAGMGDSTRAEEEDDLAERRIPVLPGMLPPAPAAPAEGGSTESSVEQSLLSRAAAPARRPRTRK